MRIRGIIRAKVLVFVLRSRCAEGFIQLLEKFGVLLNTTEGVIDCSEEPSDAV